jgi:uncharacterized protein (UPF0548 family)
MDAARARLLRAQPYTYPYVGETRTDPPPGYRRMAVREVIGAGRDTFTRAADTLLTWRMQERSGLEVVASDEVVRPGAVVVVTMRAGPARIAAPCRVAACVRDEARAGFTYGTLPGHPVSGEESFLVEHHDDGTVTAAVTAFSRPARWFTRLGAPLTGVAQWMAARRYIDALRTP